MAIDKGYKTAKDTHTHTNTNIRKLLHTCTKCVKVNHKIFIFIHLLILKKKVNNQKATQKHKS